MTTEITIPAGEANLAGALSLPERAHTLVLFVHGIGSSRHSPRNQFVARTLNNAGLATLLFDLLTPNEERIDSYSAEFRFNIELLAARLSYATIPPRKHWLTPGTKPSRWATNPAVMLSAVASVCRLSARRRTTASAMCTSRTSGKTS